MIKTLEMYLIKIHNQGSITNKEEINKSLFRYFPEETPEILRGMLKDEINSIIDINVIDDYNIISFFIIIIRYLIM